MYHDTVNNTNTVRMPNTAVTVRSVNMLTPPIDAASVSSISNSADVMLQEIADMRRVNITALQKARVNTSSATGLADEAEQLLEQAKLDWDAGNWSEAKAGLDAASAKIQMLKSEIAELRANIKPPNYGLYIWAGAIIVVVGIVAFMIRKYKGKITRAIKKEQPQQQPQAEQPQQEEEKRGYSEYRTEYY